MSRVKIYTRDEIKVQIQHQALQQKRKEQNAPPSSSKELEERYVKQNLPYQDLSLHFAIIHNNWFTINEFITGKRDLNIAPTEGELQGFTPLHVAAFTGFCDIIEILIKNGANVNAAPSEGNDIGLTPLHIAVKQQQLHASCLFIMYNADIHSGHDNFTPLHVAAETGNIDIIQLLLDCGADKTKKHHFKTAADIARENSHIEAANVIDQYALLPCQTQQE